MNFVDLQKTVRDLIAAHATFAPLAASTVFVDLGDKKASLEAALDVTSTPPGPGYAIAVWPPARGNSDSETAGINGVDCMLVVRFEVNPQFLKDQADAGKWVNTRVKDLIASVMGNEPDAGGVRFQLAADAFELVNFDEGLLAYHIRFSRFAVFGEGT